MGGVFPSSRRGMRATRRRGSYLIQGLPVGFWQVLRLAVSHGPFTHHLEVDGEASGSHDLSCSTQGVPHTHLQGLRDLSGTPSTTELWVPKKE